MLAEAFLAETREQAARGPLRIGREALAALERYAWPGNVRELQNVIERAVALADAEVLQESDLPEKITQATRADAVRDAFRSGKLAFEEAMAQFERQLLREGLERNDWNQTRTAASLGITRRQLKIKMDRHGLCR
jgi:two-component system response regulator PilR (NtrC family)